MIIYIIAGALAGFLFIKKDEVVDKVVENLPNWSRYDELFKKYGNRDGVSWMWLKAIALNESSLGLAKSVIRGFENPNDIEGSKSSDGKSWGLMQMTLPTAGDYDSSVTPMKLNNPEYSIDLASKFVKSLMSQFSKSDTRYLEWVIKSYNQGAGNTIKEKTGKIAKGYADEYWSKFQKNLTRVKDGV
jgi:membrane-bound lytic murein transglycosylase MltF